MVSGCALSFSGTGAGVGMRGHSRAWSSPAECAGGEIWQWTAAPSGLLAAFSAREPLPRRCQAVSGRAIFAAWYGACYPAQGSALQAAFSSLGKRQLWQSCNGDSCGSAGSHNRDTVHHFRGRTCRCVAWQSLRAAPRCHPALP